MKKNVTPEILRSLFPQSNLAHFQLILYNTPVDYLSAVMYLQQGRWSDPGNWAEALEASPGWKVWEYSWRPSDRGRPQSSRSDREFGSTCWMDVLLKHHVQHKIHFSILSRKLYFWWNIMQFITKQVWHLFIILSKSEEINYIFNKYQHCCGHRRSQGWGPHGHRTSQCS